jgi:hypothetical protein
VADAALHHGGLAEDGADRLPQRLGAVDDEEDALLGIQAAVDEIAEQCGGDRRVLGRALPQPSGILTPSVVMPSATTLVRPLRSMPSIIMTARRTSPSRRLMSASRFSRVRATNSRLTTDFDVERACASTSSPTSSRVRWKRRVETPASICSSTNRVSGSRAAKCR